MSPIKNRPEIDLYGVKSGLGHLNPILLENINKIPGPEDYEDPELLKKRGYTSPPKLKDMNKVLQNSLVPGSKFKDAPDGSKSGGKTAGKDSVLRNKSTSKSPNTRMTNNTSILKN